MRAKSSLRERVAAVDRGGVRQDLARREVARGLLDQLLLGRRDRSSCAFPSRAGASRGTRACLPSDRRSRTGRRTAPARRRAPRPAVRQDRAASPASPSASPPARPAARGRRSAPRPRAPSASARPARRPRCTRPMRSASSASMIAPVKISSRARADADAPRQPLRAAEAGDDAQVDLGLPELRGARGVDEVAGQRQLAAAAEREAVDRRDRSARAAPRSASPSGGRARRRRARPPRSMLGHRRDVGAGDERLVARAGQDRAAHAGVVARSPSNAAISASTRRAVERVERLGTVDGQRDDRAVARRRARSGVAGRRHLIGPDAGAAARSYS